MSIRNLDGFGEIHPFVEREPAPLVEPLSTVSDVSFEPGVELPPRRLESDLEGLRGEALITALQNDIDRVQGRIDSGEQDPQLGETKAELSGKLFQARQVLNG